MMMMMMMMQIVGKMVMMMKQIVGKIVSHSVRSTILMWGQLNSHGQSI